MFDYYSARLLLLLIPIVTLSVRPLCTYLYYKFRGVSPAIPIIISYSKPREFNISSMTYNDPLLPLPPLPVIRSHAHERINI